MVHSIMADTALAHDQSAHCDFYTKYEPKEILGRGLCSTVRRCVEKVTQRSFAVKIIDLVGQSNSGLKEASLMEIDLLRSCGGHGNIIHLEEAFETPAFMFLVFEICPHGELFDHLTKNVTFSEKKTRHYMRQILESIAYLHSKGVVHRDVKAENLLFDKDMRLKLSDFGFATRVNDGRLLRELLGTPGYLSPEMLAASMDDCAPCYGLEVDVWACGVVMYTMLSGSAPFWHRKQLKMLRMIMEGDYGFPSPQWDEVSTQAKDLIRSMLTVDTLSRITAKEALHHPFFALSEEKAPNFVKRRFKSAALAVVFACTLRKATLAASGGLSAESLRRAPYQFRPLRKAIDALAFQMYGHWVKSGDTQSRAALFQTRKRRPSGAPLLCPEGTQNLANIQED